MSISDRTRKLLWGRSGNRCAICKKELVVNATAADDESVVADECHIVSPEENGPRHDPSCPKDNLDSYNNLILLCRVHHKQVDDQQATFSADALRGVKSEHELWVSEKLANVHPLKPLKVKRVRQNIPTFLSRLTSGKEILDIISKLRDLLIFFINNRSVHCFS